MDRDTTTTTIAAITTVGRALVSVDRGSASVSVRTTDSAIEPRSLGDTIMPTELGSVGIMHRVPLDSDVDRIAV